jgi:hypothetical protein
VIYHRVVKLKAPGATDQRKQFHTDDGTANEHANTR